MFRIGDFSRIARVSCRLLRYYDEIGILKPATIERQSGYRYYSASQLPQLNRIMALKELGLDLDQISRVLDKDVSPADLRGMLLMRRAEVESSLGAETERLRRIEARIAQIDTEATPKDDDVVIREEPAHWFLGTRRLMGSFAEAREHLAEIVAQVRGCVARDALGALTVVAHSHEFEPDQLDVEIGFLLQRRCDPPETLTGFRVRELAAEKRIATCVRIGSPEEAHLITARIGRFVEANGYCLAGPSREVFLEPPRLDRMQESVVEMQFPVGANQPEHIQPDFALILPNRFRLDPTRVDWARSTGDTHRMPELESLSLVVCASCE